MKNKENESWVREKEYIQQVVYNEVLYLPVPKLKIKKQGATISDVVRGQEFLMTMEIPIILI